MVATKKPARVEMLVQISGLRNGRPWPAPGEVADVSDDEAHHLVRMGLAEPAPTPKKKTAAKKKTTGTKKEAATAPDGDEAATT